MPSRYLPILRKRLRKAGTAGRSAQMRAYMQSAMPYHGVPAPEVKRICRDVFNGATFENQKQWMNEVRAIWRGARFREERYGAMILCKHKSARLYQDPSAMALYEEMIVTGAWWDYVDEIAAGRVGEILITHPAVMKPLMRRWSRLPDMGHRRTAIISQLKFKAETDLKLLYACIEPSLGSKEFFLRKAIGWALREYAWTDPDEVKRYVRANASRLSALSQREALKNISPS